MPAASVSVGVGRSGLCNPVVSEAPVLMAVKPFGVSFDPSQKLEQNQNSNANSGFKKTMGSPETITVLRNQYDDFTKGYFRF